MKDNLIKKSVFLSLVLRHKPGEIGLVLDPSGWARVSDLLACLESHGRAMTRETLDEIVRTNEKKRFAFSPDGKFIRASQGHSVAVDLELESVAPPEFLYHGTGKQSVKSIRAQGLLPGKRHHVHLSGDEATAVRVGARHGRPVLLIVHSAGMAADGYKFFRSANGVWLVHTVPVRHIEFPGDSEV